MSSPRAIVPGVFHWTATHPRIRTEVSSYYLAETGVLIDPLLPEEGFEGGQDPIAWLRERGPPTAILLSNRHHYRHSGRLVDAFQIAVYASEPGMHEFKAGQGVEPFRFGDQLPGGVITHGVGALCPDETALEIPSVRAVALADSLVRFDRLDGALGFVPDWLLGDDPEGVKAGLRAAFGRLLELDFEHLLLAHGLPIVGEGKERFRKFVEAR
jgi:hypothetical protein